MLLLDTHLVLWAAFEPARLSGKTAKMLASREVPLAFSLATLWEISIKTSLGRPDFAVDAALLRQHHQPLDGQIGGKARPRAHQLQLIGEQGRGPAGSDEPAPRIERLGHVAGLQQRPAQPVERTRAGRGDADGLLEREHGVVEHAPVPRDHAPPDLGLRAGGCEVESLGCEGDGQDGAEEDCDAQRLHGSQYREIRRRYLRCARRSRRDGRYP